MLALGLYYLTPQGGQDRKQAAVWLQHSAEQGNTSAAMLMVAFYADAPTGKPMAFHYALLAAQHGDAVAQVMVGELYLAGEGVAKNQSEGIAFLKRAAAQGNVDALYALGRAYARGDFGITVDPAAAQNWLMQAATAGNAPAMLDLSALLYRLGDRTGGAMWLRRAAESGLPRAEALWGEDLRVGAGTAPDEAAAVAWFQKAAAQGEMLGEYELGAAYAYGRGGLAADPASARFYIERSAEHGYSLAQGTIGQMYATGNGLPQDYGAALKWFQLGAVQNEVRSLNGLGVLYLGGTGVVRDLVAAKMWFERAAAFGQPNAMHSLAAMYATGNGAPKDLKKAAYWAFLAVHYYKDAADQQKAAMVRTQLLPALIAQIPEPEWKQIGADALTFRPKTPPSGLPPFNPPVTGPRPYSFADELSPPLGP
jgi:TPR repeat protein